MSLIPGILELKTIQEAFRAIWKVIGWLPLSTESNINLAGRRIINAGQAVAEHDYITKGEVTAEITSGSGGRFPVTSHPALLHLDYASAGHTGFVPATRTISTTAPITGGGNLSADRTFALTSPLPVANGGTGTTTVFTAGAVIFAGASGVYSQDNTNFYWDNTNKRLGIGTTGLVARFTVLADFEQFRLCYDVTNYWSLSIESDGAFFMQGVGLGGELVVIPTAGQNATFRLSAGGIFGVWGVPTYANNAAAVAAGLAVGSFYRNNADPDLLCIVH